MKIFILLIIIMQSLIGNYLNNQEIERYIIYTAVDKKYIYNKNIKYKMDYNIKCKTNKKCTIKDIEIINYNFEKYFEKIKMKKVSFILGKIKKEDKKVILEATQKYKTNIKQIKDEKKKKKYQRKKKQKIATFKNYIYYKKIKKNIKEIIISEIKIKTIKHMYFEKIAKEIIFKDKKIIIKNLKITTLKNLLDDIIKEEINEIKQKYTGMKKIIKITKKKRLLKNILYELKKYNIEYINKIEIDNKNNINIKINQKVEKKELLKKIKKENIKELNRIIKKLLKRIKKDILTIKERK